MIGFRGEQILERLPLLLVQYREALHTYYQDRAPPLNPEDREPRAAATPLSPAARSSAGTFIKSVGAQANGLADSAYDRPSKAGRPM
ncbi:MAG: hypothetical protein HUU20_06425 [Pirellulales bacterium]|nr:hypothetical protein [Pirellulales bacterium]